MLCWPMWFLFWADGRSSGSWGFLWASTPVKSVVCLFVPPGTWYQPGDSKYLPLIGNKRIIFLFTEKRQRISLKTNVHLVLRTEEVWLRFLTLKVLLDWDDWEHLVSSSPVWVTRGFLWAQERLSDAVNRQMQTVQVQFYLQTQWEIITRWPQTLTGK